MKRPWRKLWHLGGGAVFPLLMLFLPRDTVLVALYAATGLALVIESLRLLVPAINRRLFSLLGVVLKEKETSKLTGASYLLLASVACFLVFDKRIAAVSLLFLAVGDPVAAAIGEKFGSRRVLGKSLEGVLGNFLTCAGLGVLLSQTVVDIPTLAVLAGATAAAVVEFLPLPVDDNLSVPLAAAGIMTLVA